MKEYPESRISILDWYVSQCKLLRAGGLVLKKLGLEKTYPVVLESNALDLVSSNSKWKDFERNAAGPRAVCFLEKGLCMKKWFLLPHATHHFPVQQAPDILPCRGQGQLIYSVLFLWEAAAPVSAELVFAHLPSNMWKKNASPWKSCQALF